jgi:alpha-2-macroglobulin
MLRWLGLAGLAFAALAPLVASSDDVARVSFAVPGSSGSSGGAINRFTIRFTEAIVPLGDPRATAPASVTCTIPSTGRWADQQTYIYEFERPLPGGLTCEVKLRDGLQSQRGVSVTGTSAFTIDTGGPSVRAMLPAEYDGEIEEDQLFLVATNVPASPNSIGQGAYCAVDGVGEKIAVDVVGTQAASKLLADLGEDHWESRNFLENAGLPSLVSKNEKERATAFQSLTALKCRRPLPPGRDVSIVWGKGISSTDGRLAGRDQRYDFTVRKAFTARFECPRINPQAGCNPMQATKLRFTSPLPSEMAMKARLRFDGGQEFAPTLSDDDKGQATLADLTFKGPFPALAGAKIILPLGVKDESGRPLANAERFPLSVKFDEAPPLVKFAAPFGIIEANEGGVLPVTVRAVEPNLGQRLTSIKGDKLRIDASDGEIAKWLRDVDKADDSDFREEQRGKESITVNYTGTKSVLAGQGDGLKLSPPAGGKDFEVVGIPLKDPGFYVVELASPMLGKALLGRPTTRYVSAAALVTNMTVHFKWGREKSLVWVTALDSATPVASADVRVTDSCSGKQLARGTSDAQGRLIVSGLPEPETYSSCAEGSSPALMVSARKAGDFSFTMTEWGDGIRPYDFDLPYGWSEAGDIFHTIFDRSLVRQGDTINMKHIIRKPIGTGFANGAALSGTLTLSHRGSGTSFDMPISIGSDGIGENSWTAPSGAPMGDYDLTVKVGEKTMSVPQSFKVDEFRLPTMRATVSGPKEALVRPSRVPLSLFVGYLSGGAASNLPVTVRTAYTSFADDPDGWEDWTFGGGKVEEGTVPLNSDGDEEAAPLPQAQMLPVSLGGDGTANASIDLSKPVDADTALSVEMDYQDANGETLTARKTIPLYASGIQLGIKTDGWMMRDEDLRLKFVTLDLDGNPVRGKPISVELFAREALTARRRLIGGFYAYDNQMRTRRLAARCAATTDKLGLAACAINAGVSGEVTVVATTTDGNGNVARAVRSVWLAGEDEWWFGGDNGDRMDVIPEQKSYKAGETAKLQVRMPFREATALVTVEREGVLSSEIVKLSGTDPVVNVKMPGSYAPDVYVSVLAVRGRIGGFKLWTAKIARDWNLPFLSRDGYAPTALVDLAKPSYRLGIARVKVGWEGHQLSVKVAADKKRYAVRETAMVDVSVKEPDGKPAKSAEIAFAAVDEALLQLQPNESWKLLDAMMGERPLSVLTSTGQMQVVGKRTYGKKAVEAGGGGGDDSAVTRTDFKPVLLWRGRVTLDGQGKARLPVQLADSLSSYRLVAIANAGPDKFGTGETAIRTSQDLSIFSGIPPLVRSGDWYGGSFTLRNGTDKPMTVTAKVKLEPAVATGEPLTVTIPAGGAAPVTWNVTAPEGVSALNWKVEASAKGGKATDAITVSQAVIPAIPIETWASTLVRVGDRTSVPIMSPVGALSGSAVVDVRLSATLAPPLEGVRRYMAAYPYGCFEQQTSRYVALSDGAAWDKLAAEIPAYIDGDGLLRYWPSAYGQGSEALTAYVLSITSDAGFVIPAEPKAKMIEAMKAVLNGRLKREAPWASNDQLLRIAALSALAKVGEATPAMLGQISLAPADMPTGALADWLGAIDRIPGANKAVRTEAEGLLRQRLAYEGSRLDISDQGNAPWWMMSSGDEMAIKVLLATLGRLGWTDDDGRMMVGVALRQQRGHWDTTLANAWGSIAARRFAARYPAQAIMGTTTASLGSVSAEQIWPMASDAKPLSLAIKEPKGSLLLVQQGGAGPWAAVSVKAAVPLLEPLFAGYRIEKKITPVIQAKSGQWSRGDVAKITITVTSTAGRNWVVINDPIPPGATVMGGLGGQSQMLADEAKEPPPSYVERGNDSWRGYFEWMPEGKRSVDYVVRLNGVGQFKLPPTRVEAMYSPAIRGQLPNQPVTVVMR